MRIKKSEVAACEEAMEAIADGMNPTTAVDRDQRVIDALCELGWCEGEEPGCYFTERKKPGALFSWYYAPNEVMTALAMVVAIGPR